MTTIEFSNEFDILYDNIATSSAPGLDMYEKSVYLTKAQLEIVKTHYSLYNKYKEGFEGSEKRRSDIKELVKHYRGAVTTAGTATNISTMSTFFQIPSNVFLIIQETAIINSLTNNCINNKVVNVVPKTHDEYNKQVLNPFKKPDENIVWRMDFSEQNNSSNVELISPFNIVEYNLRYIKNPNPIILINLDEDEFLDQGLTINGQTESQTSELSEQVHQEILDRAVQLAVRDYYSLRSSV